MNAAALFLIAAVTWYPAADWKETPDPVANPRARKGGVVRFSGGQGPKSYNAYVDNNTYTAVYVTFPLAATISLSQPINV